MIKFEISFSLVIRFGFNESRFRLKCNGTRFSGLTKRFWGLQAPIDCSPTSLCYSYIKNNASPCSKAPLCCTFRTDGSQTAYTIRINGGGCLAYQSFVGLNPNKEVPPPGKKWPDTGLELQWALPKEPVCKTDVDCNLLLGKSKCLPDPTSLGLKRCSCIRW
jgi:hypothetical protein